MDTNEHNNQELNDIGSLPRRERAARLFEALLSYPKHVPFSERVYELSVRSGISPKLLHQTARRHKWVERLTHIAEEREKQEQLGKLLDTAHAPGSTEIPYTSIAKGIKGLSMIALNASLQFVSTTVILIDYYAKRIAHAVALAGGVSHLSGDTAKQVQRWQQELTSAAKSIQEYIKPQALGALLNLINFSQNLPTDAGDIDQAAFTADSLYHRLKELGMLSAFDNPNAAVEGYGPLPILSGFVNQHDNSEVKYQGEVPDDLTT